MQSYIPQTLPLEKLDYQQFFGLVGNANAVLARYDGLLRQLKDEKVLIELQAGSGRRAATLCFADLLNLAEGRTVL